MSLKSTMAGVGLLAMGSFGALIAENKQDMLMGASKATMVLGTGIALAGAVKMGIFDGMANDTDVSFTEIDTDIAATKPAGSKMKI